MGTWSRVRDALTGGRTTDLAVATLQVVEAQVPARRTDFAVSWSDVESVLSGSSPVTYAGRVGRAAAMQVPAVKRGRDLICGTLGSLTYDTFNARHELEPSVLLSQPEDDVPASVTITRTIEDMLFEGRAWWLVLAYDWRGYPSKVKRLEPTSVNVQQVVKTHKTLDGNVGVSYSWSKDGQLIRFDSPNDALLIAAARAIKSALLLDAAALRYADGAPMADYFESMDGYDHDQDEVDALMDGFAEARRQRATGYVPSGFKYNLNPFDAQKLQLAEARQHAVLELARAMGLDPADLAVSGGTSMPYQNMQNVYLNRIKDALRPYYTAFEQRLSMTDVTPRGWTVKANFSDLLRADDQTRMEVASTGKDSEVFTNDEARHYFDPTRSESAPLQIEEGSDV